MLATVIDIIVRYREGLLSGLLVTLELCAIVWSSGLIFGIIFGALANIQKKTTGLVLKILSFFIASVPILVFIFWLHYPFQELLKIVINPFVTAAFALSVINIIMVGQIVKDALADFPQQYSLAGRVCGLSKREIFFKIELPIITRQTIPQLLAQQVNMLQMTIFASLISVEEIFRIAQRINSLIYKPVEIYTALALFFVAVCLPLNTVAYWLKIKYTRNVSEN